MGRKYIIIIVPFAGSNRILLKAEPEIPQRKYGLDKAAATTTKLGNY